MNMQSSINSPKRPFSSGDSNSGSNPSATATTTTSADQDNDDDDVNNDNLSVRHNSQHCIFCKILSQQLPSSPVYEDDVCVVILDIHPIRPGHALIIPRQYHYQSIMDMPPDVAAHMMRVAHRITEALTTTTNTNTNTNTRNSSMDEDDVEQKKHKCHGVNLLWNNGRAAWQTVMHAHLHLIPRQKGDGLAFCRGILKHLLSLMGLASPTSRQELEHQATVMREILSSDNNNDSSSSNNNNSSNSNSNNDNFSKVKKEN